jgi:hypothetical protein
MWGVLSLVVDSQMWSNTKSLLFLATFSCIVIASSPSSSPSRSRAPGLGSQGAAPGLRAGGKGSSTEELLATVVQAGAAGFSEKNYWDTFHDRNKGGEPFEWYASWQRIKDLVLSKKPPSSTVSVLVPYVLPCHPRSHPLLSFSLAISIGSPGSNFFLAPHSHAYETEKHIERVPPKIPQKIPQNSGLKPSQIDIHHPVVAETRASARTWRAMGTARSRA